MTSFSDVDIKPLKSVPVYTAPVRTPTDHLPVLDVSTLPTNMFWTVLGTALTLRRDYASATESAFVAWLARRLPFTLIDAAGNLHVDTRTLPEHRSMFTAHTDTVHSSGGTNTVHVDGDFWRATKGSALGADDGSGCAILAHMIEAGVPGYYVFFRGEERGGIGSKWAAKNLPGLFENLDRAVAFDRAGYYDIITHQSGGRCCSDEFADALGTALSTDTSWMIPCDGGVYTDTAEFTGLIAECTNISVGYKRQHGDCEEQDVKFLWELAQLAVTCNWDALPVVRDPKAKELNRYERWQHRWGADELFAADEVVVGVKTAYTDMMDDIEEDDEGYDGNEVDDTLGAIAEFRDGTDKEWLTGLIAHEAWPEDPDMARSTMNRDRITGDDLDLAEEMLYDGWSANQVLLELYDRCTIV